MPFLIDGKYRDPKTVDLDLIDAEIDAGNPHAVLLKSVLHIGGFGNRVVLGFKAAIATLDAFLEKYPRDPVCETALVVCKYFDYQENPQKDLQAVARSKAALIKRAESGDQYALVFAGVLFGAAISTKYDLARSERYLRLACAPVVDTWNDIDSVGDAFARYEYGRRLDNWTKSVQKQLATVRLTKKERLLLQEKLKEIGDKSLHNTLAAAKGGHVRALHVAGQIYRDAIPGGKYVENLTREDLDAQAEWHLLEASNQGWMPAKLSLAQFYEKKGNDEEALKFYLQAASTEEYADEGGFGLARLYDRSGKYLAALQLYTDLVSSYRAKGKTEPLLAIIDFNYDDKKGPPKRPGFKGEEVVALKACQLALQLKLTQKDLAIIRPIYEDLLSRSWIDDQATGFRRVIAIDKLNGDPPTVVPANHIEIQRILLTQATHPNAKISIDLALALADSYAKDGEGPLNKAEALRWYKTAANLGSGTAAVQAFNLCLEEVHVDLIETLRIARPLLAGKKPSDVSYGEQNYVKARARRMLAENSEDLPRVWIRSTQGVLRPVILQDITVDAITFATVLDQMMMVPSDPIEALSWYQTAARDATISASAGEVSHGNRDYMKAAARRILVENSESQPRLWIPDRNGVLRPLTLQDIESDVATLEPALEQLNIIPSDPSEALLWLDVAARDGSMSAAALAEKIYADQAQEAKAFAMYESAADKGYFTAGLALAERYFNGAGTERNYYAAQDIVSLISDEVAGDSETLSPAQALRLNTLRQSLLREAFIINAEQTTVQRVQQYGRPDLKIRSLEEVRFFHPDKNGFAQLTQFQNTSADAVCEIVNRLVNGIEGQKNLTEAFTYLSYLLFGGTILPEYGPVISRAYPERSKLQNLWCNLATHLTETSNPDDTVTFTIAGSPKEAEPLSLTRDIYETSFRTIIRAASRGECLES